jgi:alpha(1,3/1,4) fucosyltransferase
MPQRVRIDFLDFWKGFDRYDNYFTRLLRPHFDLEIVDDPDFVIYSCSGKRHRRFPGIRIFYTAENTRPDFCVADYVFSFDYSNHPDHFRLPYYATSVRAHSLLQPSQSPEEILAAKTGFCNFVFTNPRCRVRNRFFHKLSKYKRVDSGGKFMNNVGGPVADKLAFQRKYKFSIAFENSKYPGYTTEKMPEAVAAGTLPLYWGNSLVYRDFNPARFLHYDDFGSDEALIERVIELDRNDDQYLEYLRQPLFYDNRPNEYYDPAPLVERFEEIFATQRRPVAESWPKYLGFQTKRLGRNFHRLLPKAKYPA